MGWVIKEGRFEKAVKDVDLSLRRVTPRKCGDSASSEGLTKWLDIFNRVGAIDQREICPIHQMLEVN